MKKYINPEMAITGFDDENVETTASSQLTSIMQEWESQHTQNKLIDRKIQDMRETTIFTF